MATRKTPVLLRRAGAELALLVAVGVVMAFLGPFQTADRPLSERLVYWLILMMGGGVIGIAIDEVVMRRLPGFWARLATVSLAMTPLVTLLVMAVTHVMYGASLEVAVFTDLLFQVFVVCAPTMALRQLAWRAVWHDGPSPAEAEPDSWAAFRQRLSARRRGARLIAVEAEDHYLRVHTDAGDELITLRFSDALEELSAASGFRTHRSWWVAADAIEAVRWRRGRGELRLAGGLSAPVSRSQAPVLKKAGWF
jgi:DNA-binding LytR/AlgR family response regulator